MSSRWEDDHNVSDLSRDMDALALAMRIHAVELSQHQLVVLVQVAIDLIDATSNQLQWGALENAARR